MSFFDDWPFKKREKILLRQRAMAIHDRVVEQVLQITTQENLGLTDDFALRFDVMILLIAAVLFKLRSDKILAQELWDLTFEGLEVSFRQRGVNDIRIAARMAQAFQQATGRRNAYLTAMEAEDHDQLRVTIARNVLGNSKLLDERVDLLLSRVHTLSERSLSLHVDSA